ncbi:hypothetical protein [Vibrio ouci]|uniref:Uncharacterized protein n=1 Tax=Vibrio ouci TaxID=2499078 RepID=A0A4Y8WC95_9VIBR|nr:hypothetical protein [Vibrio ouci]TFH90276.1 hypothetical protein ELS82_17700 [Vibrio ouci]
MGKMWPQLRTPLALAILKTDDKWLTDAGSFNLNDLELSRYQAQILVETAIKEHNKYNLPTDNLTLESMRYEWKKSLNAANTLVDSYEQQIINRLTQSRVDSVRHKSRSEFLEVIGTSVFLLKQDKTAAQMFRESFALENGREVRCALVAQMRGKLLAVGGNEKTAFHQLAALGLDEHYINNEKRLSGCY